MKLSWHTSVVCCGFIIHPVQIEVSTPTILVEVIGESVTVLLRTEVDSSDDLRLIVAFVGAEVTVEVLPIPSGVVIRVQVLLVSCKNRESTCSLVAFRGIQGTNIYIFA